MNAKSIITAALFVVYTSFCVSQTRYLDYVFNDIEVSKNVKYGENYNQYLAAPSIVLEDLYMDIYEPKGDTISNRPLIILAHGGSFLKKCAYNTLPHGDKEDSAMVEMCTRLARKGYVAVSMDYRLGWNPISTDPDIRNGSILQAIYLGMQDMKACVRYMKSSHSIYDVDTNNIIIGGSESGAFISLMYNALSDTNELKKLDFLHSTTGKPYIEWNKWGDFEGKDGDSTHSIYNNPGPSSKVHLVLSLGGAILDTSWIESDDRAIIAFHGVQNAMTYYKTRIGTPIPSSDLWIYGSYYVIKTSQKRGNQHFYDHYFSDDFSMAVDSIRENLPGLYPFPGAANGYEPYAWYDENSPCIDSTGTGYGSAANPYATKTKAMAYIDTIMGYFCPRAMQALRLPGNSVSIDEKKTGESKLMLYPNPASDKLYFKNLPLNSKLRIYNSFGQLVLDNHISERGALDVSELLSGTYILKIVSDNFMKSELIIIQKH